MSRPKLLDLFCCQGGASAGYFAAGFEITGVDIAEQPLYPFEFHRGDALEFIVAHGHEFDVIHASPPCQANTSMSNRWRGQGGKADSWVSLIRETRAALEATGRVWVLENVTGARSEMVNPLLLHGGMFGMRVDRPRLFDSNVLLMAPGVVARARNPVGVYGKTHDGRRLWTRADGTSQFAAKSLAEAREVMGMPWADWDGCREAIPPSFTSYLGEQLLEHLSTVSGVSHEGQQK